MTKANATLTWLRQALTVDPAATVERITSAIREQVLGVLRRKGVVVGLSGGVDSSVVAALCARALGNDKVLALLMPDRDSSPDSLTLGRQAGDALGFPLVVEDIGEAAEAAGCYRRQREAVREVFPECQDDWKFKLTLPSLLAGDRLAVFRLSVETPGGERQTKRMPAPAYRQLVAATNFKQRLRKLMEYYHADRLAYAVAGTPNRLEYDQGFFVKQGDGAADIKPIAHLYKTQVYQLAAFLGVPEEICNRPPTTDTFSLPQTQEEFYFSLPYDKMDMCLYAHNHGIEAHDLGAALELNEDQVLRIYRDIEQKRLTTRYLHAAPLLVEGVPEV